MPFKFVRGRTRIKAFPKTTSTVFTRGDLCIMTSGVLATATAGDNASTIVGIALKNVASTDSDYASAGAQLLVEMPTDSQCYLEGPVSNGSLLTTSLGVKFGLTSAGAVDFADTTNTDLMCVQFISSSLGVFQLENDAVWNG